MVVTSVPETCIKHQDVPKGIPIGVQTPLVTTPGSQSPQTLLLCEEEDEEISNEELAQSYTVLYENWVNILKIDENLQAYILQLSQDKGIL